MPYETMILISVSNYNQFSQDYYDSVINSLPFHRLTCSCGHSACLSIHRRHGYARRNGAITSSNKLRTYTSSRYYTEAEILDIITGKESSQ